MVDKNEHKTKNDYFLEMLAELLAWGLSPAMVTGDSWYSCAKNLKAIKNYGLGFMFRSKATVNPTKKNFSQFERRAFELEHDKHWQIEHYHRAIKQICNIEKFQVRGKQATKNHLFAAIYEYMQLQRLTTT